MKMKILSGIQPSGMLHIGNQLGSMRQWLMFQEVNGIFEQHGRAAPFENQFFIADMHCWTDQRNFTGTSMKDSILQCQLMLLASGLRPSCNHIYLQSRIKSLGKFYQLINSLSTLPRLQRMHHWKDKSTNNKSTKLKVTKDGQEQVISDLTNNIALLSQPCLMTADILSFKPDQIPVGDDQIQHLNFTNDVILELNRVTDHALNQKSINNEVVLEKINQYLIESQILESKRYQDPKTNLLLDPNEQPKHIDIKDYQNIKIKSLRNPSIKMSKSVENSFISLQDSNDMICERVRSALTDNLGLIGDNLEERDGIKNMINIARLVLGNDFQTVHQHQIGKDIRLLKSDLQELLIGFVQPIRALYHEMIQDKEQQWQQLLSDSEKMSNKFDEHYEELESSFQKYK